MQQTRKWGVFKSQVRKEMKYPRNEIKGRHCWHVCAAASVNLPVDSEGKACGCNVCWCGGGEKKGGRGKKNQQACLPPSESEDRETGRVDSLI